MPEGDSVWKAARRLREQLVGRTVVRLRLPRAAARHGRPVRAQVVTAFDSYGKHMLTRFSGGLTLHTHFEMDGSWQVVGPGKALPRTFDDEVRLVLRTDGPTAYALRMPVRRAARDRATRTGSSATSGPDLLGPVLGRGRGRRAGCRQDPDRPLVEALLDQRASPASATCGRSRPATCAAHSPWTPVRDVDLRGRGAAGPPDDAPLARAPRAGHHRRHPARA